MKFAEPGSLAKLERPAELACVAATERALVDSRLCHRSRHSEMEVGIVSFLCTWIWSVVASVGWLASRPFRPTSAELLRTGCPEIVAEC